MDTIEIIVKHGRYAASKWACNADQRPYWEARYCGLQCLYNEIANKVTSYEDFNAHCGITFNAGHIVSADGTKCGY